MHTIRHWCCRQQTTTPVLCSYWALETQRLWRCQQIPLSRFRTIRHHYHSDTFHKIIGFLSSICPIHLHFCLPTWLYFLFLWQRQPMYTPSQQSHTSFRGSLFCGPKVRGSFEMQYDAISGSRVSTTVYSADKWDVLGHLTAAAPWLPRDSCQHCNFDLP